MQAIRSVLYKTLLSLIEVYYFSWIDRDKCEPVEIYIQEWLDLGVRYVGGCCRTYAADVSRIRNQVHCWRDRWRFQRYSGDPNTQGCS